MSYTRRKTRRARSSNPFIPVVIGIGSLLVASMVIGAAFFIVAMLEEPSISELTPVDHGATSVVLAADGSRLGFIESDELRTPIGLPRINSRVRKATIAVEDSRFQEHHGVDPQGIARAFVRNVQARSTSEGGSTITQQLVRNLYLSSEKTWSRKINEARLATQMEQERSKRWILREYLNTVPYGTVQGQTAIGVEAAARLFFNSTAKQLSLAQAALLAGLPQAPSSYNPFLDPHAAKNRRNQVLERMYELKMITSKKYLRATGAKLGIDKNRYYTHRREGYFFDFVKERLIEHYGVNVVRQGGLVIHTPLAPKLQQAARDAIGGQLGQPGDPSAAVVSIDPRTGHIRAMTSAGDAKGNQFNYAAQGKRQPGSTFKTMVLLAALREGIDPYSKYYTSMPLSLELPGYGNWSVSTYDGSYGGSISVAQATLQSDNSVYAQLDLEVGPEKVRDAAYAAGIKTPLQAYPAEGLGGLERGVSPLEMANAYATFAAGGIRSQPVAITRVDFPDGKQGYPEKRRARRVFSDGIAAVVTDILGDNLTQGTGTRAQFGCPAAGKTGTTDAFTDAWLVGYTPHLATSVWVGYPDSKVSMTNVHGIPVNGGSFPAAIWGQYMATARGDDCSDFPVPSEPFPRAYEPESAYEPELMDQADAYQE